MEENTPFTRAEFEEIGRSQGTPQALIDELWTEWQHKTKEDLSRLGLRTMMNEVLREDLLPGFTDWDPNDSDSVDERFVAWKFFKAEVIRIAGELEGKSLRKVVNAVLARYWVTRKRASSIAAYVAYALECEAGTVKDQLPDLGTLVLGEGVRDTEH